MSPKIPLLVIVAAALFALAMMGLLVAAHAQSPCSDAKTMIKILSTKYNESEIAAGSTDTGDIIRWYGNPDKPTWSLVLFHDGLACLMISGTSFNQTPYKAPLGPEL